MSYVFCSTLNAYALQSYNSNVRVSTPENNKVHAPEQPIPTLCLPKKGSKTFLRIMMNLRRSRGSADILPHIWIPKLHPTGRLILANPLPPPILMPVSTLFDAEDAIAALTLATKGLYRISRSFTTAVGFLGFEVATVGGVVLLDATLGLREVGGDTAR